MKLYALFGVFIALLCLQSASALQCSGQWQCQSVSDIYQAAECVDGHCVCVYDQGFTGSATVEHPCGCSSDITWKQSKAYCIDIPAVAAATAKTNRRIQVLRDLYTAEIYQDPVTGGPSAVISNYYTGADTSLPDRLFADIVIGRVKEAGIVEDRDQSVDYFYGNSDFYGQHWVTVHQIHFGQSVNDPDILQSEVIFASRSLSAPDGVPILLWNITQTGHWRFNEHDQITKFDLSIHQLGKATDRFDPEGPIPGLPEGHPFFGLDKAQRYCTLYFTPKAYGGAGCTPADDPAGHYTDLQDCVDFNRARPNGSWGDVPADSQTCMGYHVTRSVWNSLHCSHAGKVITEKCFYHSPDSYQQENEKYN
jgi:hypothetical protein